MKFDNRAAIFIFCSAMQKKRGRLTAARNLSAIKSMTSWDLLISINLREIWLCTVIAPIRHTHFIKKPKNCIRNLENLPSVIIREPHNQKALRQAAVSLHTSAYEELHY